MSIRLLLIRLVIGSNQPRFIPKTQPRIVRTHIIRIKTDSDSKDVLLVIHQITQTISRALIREILKD